RRDASFRRCCSSCRRVCAARRRASSASSSADCNGKPRRRSPASKAAGSSRMDFKSCIAACLTARIGRSPKRAVYIRRQCGGVHRGPWAVPRTVSDRRGGARLLDVRIVAAQLLLAPLALFLLALVAVALDHHGEPNERLVEDQKQQRQTALT